MSRPYWDWQFLKPDSSLNPASKCLGGLRRENPQIGGNASSLYLRFSRLFWRISRLKRERHTCNLFGKQCRRIRSAASPLFAIRYCDIRLYRSSKKKPPEYFGRPNVTETWDSLLTFGGADIPRSQWYLFVGDLIMVLLSICCKT